MYMKRVSQKRSAVSYGDISDAGRLVSLQRVTFFESYSYGDIVAH